MQTHTHTAQKGGRISSALYRQACDYADHFEGLKNGKDRYQLLLLVKKTGKLAGFSKSMIALLDYYMAFTRDHDWEEGSNPIVYQSIARTALDLDLSERQVQRLERSLFEAGAITWHDSGNHKRYGQRDPKTGKLIYAYGVDLTPLASLSEKLTQLLEQKQKHDHDWMQTKRKISWYRAQIRGIEKEQGRALPDTHEALLTKRLRTSLSLADLQVLCAAHKDCYDALIQVDNDPKPDKMSALHDKNDGHIQSTTQQSFNKLKSPRPSDTRFSKEKNKKSSLTTKQQLFINYLSQLTFIQAMDLIPKPHQSGVKDWQGYVDYAYRLKQTYGLSNHVWAKACEIYGRNGAAVCLLLTHQGTQRSKNPVQNPAAYFWSLLG